MELEEALDTITKLLRSKRIQKTRHFKKVKGERESVREIFNVAAERNPVGIVY